MFTGEIKGDKLILEIDVSAIARENARPSKSGKSRILATTNGFTRFGDVKVNLNATIPLAEGSGTLKGDQ
jgi:hypothetical protein